MRLTLLAAAFCLAAAAPSGAAPAQPSGLRSGPALVLTVRHARHVRHARTRIRVHPSYYGTHDYPYGRPVRGFMDTNPTHQGNHNGCVVDLGYGRYETCSSPL